MNTNKRNTFIGIGIILGIITISLLTLTPDVKSGSHEEKNEIASEEKTKIRTLYPEKIRDESTVLPGTILSHETADIFPRRGGIVKDILVDIGDQVEEGQTIALLLPQGVEGQSNAAITKMQAYRNQASSDLKNAQSVAAQAVENAQQRIDEIQIELETAKKKRDSIIDQSHITYQKTIETESSNENNAQQNIEVYKTQVESAKQNILSAQEDQNASQQLSAANIDQKLEQAEVAISHARQTIEQALIQNGGRSSSITLNQQDFIPEFGASNNQLQNDVIQAFNQTLTLENQLITSSLEEKKAQINTVIQSSNNTLNKVLSLLKATVTSVNLSQSSLNNIVHAVHNAQNNLLQKKEQLEDAYRSHNTLLSSHKEEMVHLQNALSEKKELLIKAETSLQQVKSNQNKNVAVSEKELEKVQTVQNSQIAILEEKLQSAITNKQYIASQQQQSVERVRNGVVIADAQLSEEVAKSGHTEIKSPFSGIVAKRFISVGETIMTSSAAFQLVDVQTTLAQKAKREIQFGLPEHLNNEVDVGDTITFFLPNSETEIHTALVTRKSPQVDPETHTITVQAKIENDLNLPHHSNVRITFKQEKEPVFRIPSRSVKRDGENNIVWKNNENNSFEKIQVDVLAEDGEFAEVTGNLDETTEILINPALVETSE